jgi:hypothetical protein
MKPIVNTIKMLVENLVEILDTDIEHVDTTLASLNDLRAGIIKRDEKNLEALLAEIQDRQFAYVHNEKRREAIRNEIAGILAMPAERVNISEILEHIDEPVRTELLERKIALDRLIGRLKVEYASTVSLVSQCSRFNKKLLDGILTCRSKGATTYNAAGSAKSCGGNGLLNMQF